jgi:hypothetical protein
MNWDETDFIVAGAIVAITVTLLLLATRLSGRNRWLAMAAIIVVVLVVWAELAVGIFGTPFAGN